MHKPFFHNVDLEIESCSSLELFVKELGRKVVVLHSDWITNDLYLLSLEVTRSTKHADATIHALCSLVESLSPKAKQLWNRATRKDFDIGYENRSFPSRFTLRADTLKRIAKLGATLAVTCYEKDPNEFICPNELDK